MESQCNKYLQLFAKPRIRHSRQNGQLQPVNICSFLGCILDSESMQLSLPLSEERQVASTIRKYFSIKSCTVCRSSREIVFSCSTRLRIDQPNNISTYGASPKQVLFLLNEKFLEGASYSSLSCSRSVLSLIVSPSVGSGWTKRFFRGVMHLRPQRPQKTKTFQHDSTCAKNSALLTKFETLRCITKCEAHSTRHASASAPMRSGIPVDAIISTAGWSHDPQIFAKFYNRPLDP
nr:unnamed protein product [Callosobruchus analis]